MTATCLIKEWGLCSHVDIGYDHLATAEAGVLVQSPFIQQLLEITAVVEIVATHLSHTGGLYHIVCPWAKHGCASNINCSSYSCTSIFAMHFFWLIHFVF